MKWLRELTCLMLVVALAGGAVADEKEKKGKRGRKAPSVTQRLVAKLELTDAQKEQVAAIDKKFADKAKDLAAKRKAILTPEQQQAQREAMQAAKEARAEGKNAKEIRQQIANAVQLTEAQQKQQQDLQAAQQELNKQVLAELKTVLTPEQQEQLPKARGAKGKKADRDSDKPRKKKKDAA